MNFNCFLNKFNSIAFKTNSPGLLLIQLQRLRCFTTTSTVLLLLQLQQHCCQHNFKSTEFPFVTWEYHSKMDDKLRIRAMDCKQYYQLGLVVDQDSYTSQSGFAPGTNEIKLFRGTVGSIPK